MVDLAAQHAPLSSAFEKAFRRVLDSSRFILGPEVIALENEAAAYLGAEHAIGVSSGSDALLIALTALGVGSGDEVITTPFTFFATVEAILRLGARPRFVDVDPRTLQLDVGLVLDAISPRTRAIVPVHLYGTPVKLDELARVAAQNQVPIVEDAAQSFGSRYGGRSVGTWGACGCFSFFPTKVFGALGDGGLVVTNDEELASKCRRLRQHGVEKKGEHTEVGGNFRLDAMQAAMLRVKLPLLDTWIGQRRAHAAEYDAGFEGVASIGIVSRGEGWNGAIYTMRIRHGLRDALRRQLQSDGIESAVYYPMPLHLQPVVHAGMPAHAMPVSEEASAEVLSVPLYPELGSDQRGAVIDAVRAFLR